MTLEEFNSMMGRFIDRTKKMMNIGKLMETVKEHIIKNQDDSWDRFFNAKLFNEGNKKPTNFHINQQWLHLKFDNNKEIDE